MPRSTSSRSRGGRRGAARRRDEALVLRRYPYGESSLLVHVLTPERGRVHLLAKGAYRPKSAYCGVLDLFDTLRLEWSERPDSELGVLVKGDIQRRRAQLARRLDRYQVALTMLDLAGVGARSGHEERELFGLLEEMLDALRGPQEPGAGLAAPPPPACDAPARVPPSMEPALLGAVFELRFLALQGLEPALSRCASCGERVEDERGPRGQALFSTALGGRLCERCAASAGEDLQRHPPGVLRVAQSLLDTPVAQLGRIQLDSERSRRLRFFVRHFLEYHLDSRPRSFGPPATRYGGRRTSPRTR